jgi:hypothetical protein
MRTTINLDPDVIEIARRYSQGRSLSLGKAVSELVRRGVARPLETREENGFHVVVLPEGSASGEITLELVNKLRDEVE